MKGSSANGRRAPKPQAITGVPVLMRTSRFIIFLPSLANREGKSLAKADVGGKNKAVEELSSCTFVCAGRSLQ